jgi:hypothetical protein
LLAVRRVIHTGQPLQLDMPQVHEEEQGCAVFGAGKTWIHGAGLSAMPSIGPPLNVLTRNAGAGVLEVQWDAPAVGAPAWYAVWISIDNLNFAKATFRPIRPRWCRIPNLPTGRIIYAQVVAVASDGTESVASATGKDASAGIASLSLRFTGTPGAQINVGGIYSSVIGGQPVSVQLTEGGVIP